MKHSYLLAGISMGKLFKLLAKNGFSLSPKYLIRIIFLLQGSVFATIFNRIEKIKKEKHLQRYQMPDDPVFIIGHWRTGTTLLHQLMAMDDQLVTPTVYHVSTPESFLISEKFYRPVMRRAMQSTRPMDNVKLGFDEPQEEEYALIKMTAESPLEGLLFPETDNYYLAEKMDYLPKNQEIWTKKFTAFCKRLSFIDKKRVLLKNPFHTLRLPLLLQLFPGAKFIHLHRHPYEVIPSTINMWNIVGEENRLKRKKQHITIKKTAEVYDRLLSDIRAFHFPGKSIIEIGFHELESKPFDTLKKIYSELGVEFSKTFEKRVVHKIHEISSHLKNTYILSDEDKETIAKILEKHFIYYNYTK